MTSLRPHDNCGSACGLPSWFTVKWNHVIYTSNIQMQPHAQNGKAESDLFSISNR